jgi:hypothetical protein
MLFGFPCLKLSVLWFGPLPEGNTEEENNGYVVLKGNIRGSAGKVR